MATFGDQSLARWAFYDFFSKIWYKPEEDMLTEEFKQLLIEANQEYQAIHPELITRFCSSISENVNLQDILVEYSKLFVGPAEILAPPYESYYRDNKTIMGTSTIGVKKFYQKTGMEMVKEIKEPPDHIAIEMNYLAQLFCMQTRLLEEGNTDKAEQVMTLAAEFYLQHPAAWVEDFLYLVKQESQHEFYSLAADIMLNYHHRELKYYKQVAFN